MHGDKTVDIHVPSPEGADDDADQAGVLNLRETAPDDPLHGKGNGPALETDTEWRTRASGPFVRMMIALSVVLVIAMMAVIYQRWQRSRFPTSYIIPQGDKSVEGAQVSVNAIGPPPHEIARVELKEASGWTAPVLVEPGIYRVDVFLKGELILQHSVIVPHMRGVRLIVTDPRKPPQTALMGGTEIGRRF